MAAARRGRRAVVRAPRRVGRGDRDARARARCRSRSRWPSGVPLGIWAGRRPQVERVLRPILDAMQTIPAYAYLLPAVLLFGIGNPPALMATLAFALPPAIRLTALGIRGVPETSLEVADVVRLHRAAAPAAGAGAAREALDHARGEPDDHDGARHRRDRGVRRRRRARPDRARRAAAAQRRSGAERRHRDRRDGDRARPRDDRVEPARPPAHEAGPASPGARSLAVQHRRRRGRRHGAGGRDRSRGAAPAVLPGRPGSSRSRRPPTPSSTGRRRTSAPSRARSATSC